MRGKSSANGLATRDFKEGNDNDQPQDKSLKETGLSMRIWGVCECVNVVDQDIVEEEEENVGGWRYDHFAG